MRLAILRYLICLCAPFLLYYSCAVWRDPLFRYTIRLHFPTWPILFSRPRYSLYDIRSYRTYSVISVYLLYFPYTPARCLERSIILGYFPSILYARTPTIYALNNVEM